MTFEKAPSTAAYALLNRVQGRTYYFSTYAAAQALKMEFLVRYRTAEVDSVLSSPHYQLQIYAL